MNAQMSKGGAQTDHLARRADLGTASIVLSRFLVERASLSRRVTIGKTQCLSAFKTLASSRRSAFAPLAARSLVKHFFRARRLNGGALGVKGLALCGDANIADNDYSGTITSAIILAIIFGKCNRLKKL